MTDRVRLYNRWTTRPKGGLPVKRTLIRPGVGGMLAALTLLAALRLQATPPVPAEPEVKPLEVTYYFLPG